MSPLNDDLNSRPTDARESAPSADLGLLLDVDGPIASPETRTVSIPSIARDIVRLAAASVPVSFITGRSDVFIVDAVLPALERAGLTDALATPGARMFGVFEKGGTWAPITASGLGALEVDPEVIPPPAFVNAVRDLISDQFADLVFFDDTKRAMVSVEQNIDVPNAEFLARRDEITEALAALAREHGLSIDGEDRTFRLDPTIISIDVESVALDKDFGARRALAYFAESGSLPRRWRSVGDSRSDYLMSDEVHDQGFEVAHVDVRPSDGVLSRPYPIITIGDLHHDAAGAAFLAYWADRIATS